MFFPSRNTIFQCKIETDSDANLRRVETMWQKLPPWMQEWQPMKYTYCQAVFPRSRSQILAVPQGSKHFRGKTLSGIMCDEAAFMDELNEVIAAAKPALGKIGKFTCISSAAPGAFSDLCFDVAS
jgi:hypothetical protein